MLTIAVIVGKNGNTSKYLDNIIDAWDLRKNNNSPKTVRLLKLNSIKELDAPYTKVLIFHPRSNNNNPPWFSIKKIYDYTKITIYNDDTLVFGHDGGKLLEDIEKHKPEYMNSKFVKIPVAHGFKSLYAHIAVAIVLWELFKKNNQYDLSEW